MRKIILALALTGFAVSGRVAAAPTAPTAAPAPTAVPRVSLPIMIAAARRTQPGPVLMPYSEGPVSYDVEISNPTGTTLTTELVIVRGIWMKVGPAAPPEGSWNPGAQIAKVPVSVAPGARAWVSYVDPEGQTNGCAPSVHKFTMVVPAGKIARDLRITPSCTFAVDITDPTAGYPPDNKQRLREGVLSYSSNPALSETALSCSGTPNFHVKTRLTNKSSVNVVGATVRIDPPGTGTGKKSAGSDVAPGQSSELISAPVGFTQGLPGAYTLRIEAAAGVPVYQPNWGFKVARKCQLALSLE